MSPRLDRVDAFVVLTTQVYFDLSGLWIFHRASSETLASMEKSDDWMAEEREGLDDKDFRKRRGAALFGYRDYLLKLTIGASAIIIESACISIKDITGQKVDLWSQKWDSVPYATEARKMTALHNVVKHNRGVIQRSSSSSSRFLVDHCGVPDGNRVVHLEFDVPEELFRTYGFLLHLVAAITGVRPPALRGSEKKLRGAFGALMPSFSGGQGSRRTTA